MSDRESYFIHSEGPNVQSAKKAFLWFLKYPSDRGFLAVMGYGNLRGVISDILGDRAIKSLMKTGSLRLDGKEILLVTERKFIYSGKNFPLTAFYPSSKFLDELDSIPNLSAMLVVPWIMKEVEPWVRTRNAQELEAEKAEPAELIPNKIVVEALKSLTATVNVSTGVAHPRDREATIQTFMILRDAGEYFNPEDVKAWLIRNGKWKAPDAQEVAVLAQKVLEGRRLKKGSSRWRKDILEIWREEAKKSG